MSFDTINFLQWIGRSLAASQKGLGHAQLSAGLGTARREEMVKNCCWQVTAPFPAEHKQQVSMKRDLPSVSTPQKSGSLRGLRKSVDLGTGDKVG